MMLAYEHMMRFKISMPAMFLRESNGQKGGLFDKFSAVAQNLGVYTGFDYVDIIERLNTTWDIASMEGLTDEAEKARDYLMKLPARMYRLSERMKIPENSFKFKWVEPAIIK